MDAIEQQATEPAETLPLLMQFAQVGGNIAEYVEENDLAMLAGLR